MAESWAEFLTALAAMSVYIVGECHPLEVDGPARLADPPESLQNWIDDLSIHLITLQMEMEMEPLGKPDHERHISH